MKKSAIVALAALLCLLSSGCSEQHHTPMSAVDRVESAYDEGRYVTAQAMADSLVIHSDFGSLDVYDLCRLSLVLMRLGEVAGESEVNTAFAAHCLKAAVARDSDSTSVYVQAMPLEDRARILMLTAINEAAFTPLDTDSIAEVEIYEQ